MVFELTNQLEHLQGVKAQVGEQLALGQGINGSSTQTFENVDGVTFEPIGRRRIVGACGTRRGFCAPGI